MKLAHNAVISVFVKEGEDKNRIRDKLLDIVPIDLEKEKITLGESTAEGFDKKIKIFEIRLEKERHVNLFLNELISKLNLDQKRMLIDQLDSRVDEECNFFVRLDKSRLLDGEYFVTDSGDCFHIRILVASYPAKKERAKEIVKKILEG